MVDRDCFALNLSKDHDKRSPRNDNRRRAYPGEPFLAEPYTRYSFSHPPTHTYSHRQESRHHSSFYSPESAGAQYPCSSSGALHHNKPFVCPFDWDYSEPFDLRVKRPRVASPPRCLQRVARTLAKDLTDCVAISKNAATAAPSDNSEACLPASSSSICAPEFEVASSSSCIASDTCICSHDPTLSESSAQVPYEAGLDGSRGSVASTVGYQSLSIGRARLSEEESQASSSSVASSGYQTSSASGASFGNKSKPSVGSNSSASSLGYHSSSSSMVLFDSRSSSSSDYQLLSSLSLNNQATDLAGSLLQSRPISLNRVRHQSVSLSAAPLSCPTPEPASKEGRLADYLADCLLKYGLCIVDTYMGSRNGMRILKDVRERANDLHEGRLMSDELESNTVRGDETRWLEAGISPHIDSLVSRLDSVMRGLAHRLDATYQITSRTKAMVARYSGSGQCYVRHVDNHRQDGRCITVIYYLNQNYQAETNGGLLRLYPSRLAQSIDVEPKFDRVIFFWSDHRTPHEVLPTYKERYAITVWYFDEIERQQAKQRMSQSIGCDS